MKTASKIHSTKRKICLAAVAVLILGACHEALEHNAQLYVFGTVVDVTLYDATNDQAAQVFSEMQEMFQDMHQDWHAWEPGLLTEINEAFASGRSIEANEEIVEMVRRSQDLETRSGGRFNPAIGELIRLWGFHTSNYPIFGPPPSNDEISRAIALMPSSRDIQIDGLILSTDNMQVQLDFGGIAKGYAVDLAIERLHELGVKNAIVNTGGDLRAIGDHGDRPWRIAVRKPGGGVIGVIEVRADEALFTSGNYERFRQDETNRYPHILDPRTGWPVKYVASATVISGEGLLADAAATALIVAGLEDWPEVARDLELEQVMIIDEQGHVYMTPQMEERVRFLEASIQVTITPTQ